MYTCAPACVHISSFSLFIAAHSRCSFFVHYPEQYSGNPREGERSASRLSRAPPPSVEPSAVVRRVSAVGRTLGVFAEYRSKKRSRHRSSLALAVPSARKPPRLRRPQCYQYGQRNYNNYSTPALGRTTYNNFECNEKCPVPLHFTLYAIHQNRGSAAKVTFEILKQQQETKKCVLLRLMFLYPLLYLPQFHRLTTERTPRELRLNSQPLKSAFC